MTRAASIGLSGIPRPFAMFIKLPNGRIPRVTLVSRSTAAAGATVPSPPATITTGKPSATAIFAMSAEVGPSAPVSRRSMLKSAAVRRRTHSARSPSCACRWPAAGFTIRSAPSRMPIVARRMARRGPPQGGVAFSSAIGGEMVRPSATGLATAFFRLYLLESLATGPARPAALLAAIAAERLPFAAGAFGRALQSLIEGGYLAPAAAANVCLTSLGVAERAQERERWAEMLPTLVRLLGDAEPRPFPVVAQVAPPRERPVAEAYLDRVLVASVRERIAAAKDGGPTFAVVLGQLDVEGVGEATRRAMVHRAIRATLGATATLLGGDVSAYRYGDSGVAALAPTSRDAARAERLRTLVRARLDELMRTMTSTVRAFGTARWNVRAGAATWSDDVATTTVLLRQAEAALAGDNDRRDAA